MRILVAGAGGAIGRQLVPRLLAAGHEVHGTTRTPEGVPRVRALGAEPVVMEALDPAAVAAAVAASEPEVVVHQLTSLPEALDPRHAEREFAVTNRLRTEGTDHLLAAARAAGVRRFVAQSFAGWPYARTGDLIKAEDAPLDPDPVPAMRATVEAIRYLERAVTSAAWTEGVVLRYGLFCGPGTSLSPAGAQVEAIRRRRLPVVGEGSGIWSFVRVEDAADATVLAVERAAPGVYNVVDDQPAPVAEWLPAAARAMGAPPPWHVPAWLGRLLGGPVVVAMMTTSRGASNARVKEELGWQPRLPTWQDGFGSEAA